MSFKDASVVAMTEEDIKRERAEQRKSFRDHVRELLRTRFQGDRQAFYTAANLDRRLFSKIVSYAGYNPSKETALAIAVGARLTESEALDLLRVAGFNWNESSSSDIVYRACLRHQVYEWEHIRDFLKRFAR